MTPILPEHEEAATTLVDRALTTFRHYEPELCLKYLDHGALIQAIARFLAERDAAMVERCAVIAETHHAPHEIAVMHGALIAQFLRLHENIRSLASGDG